MFELTVKPKFRFNGYSNTREDIGVVGAWLLFENNSPIPIKNIIFHITAFSPNGNIIKPIRSDYDYAVIEYKEIINGYSGGFIIYPFVWICDENDPMGSLKAVSSVTYFDDTVKEYT